MPERETLRRARKDKAEGKAPSTQAGEFVREEIDHIREGKHGARSAKQAIAIGLSKARRAGVKESALAQKFGNAAVARAEAAAATAMREKNDACCSVRHEKIAVQRDGTGADVHESFVLCIPAIHGVTPPAFAARSSSSCTSASLVCEKSSYQSPTA
ncbi:MAG: hypothetical protein QOK37_170 [Thermoanaerobaculia bacterium]|nr:hypothetical protein [Thermoanaerobaculia bacterium]